MTVSTVLSKDLEASAEGAGIVSSEEAVLGPLHVAVVGAHFRHLFFVALDTPEGTDVITVAPALGARSEIHDS